MPDRFHEWKDYYTWSEDDFLTITDNPCAVCGKRRTIGVFTGQTTWFCAEHLPEEFWSAERKKGAAHG